jgi:hypothetical protein
MSESDAERGTLPLRDGKNSGMESKKGKRREELRIGQKKRSCSSTRSNKLVREEGIQRQSRRY